MKVFFDDRPCGSGKTYGELLHMATHVGRYLFVVDQKRSMRERESELRTIALRLGRRLPIVLIESGATEEEYRHGLTTARVSTSVRVAVAAVPQIHDVDHIVVIVTHEALKLADLADFGGWHLVIDETPSILDQQQLQTNLSRDFFRKHYALRSSGKRFEITSCSSATAADMRRDTLTNSVAVMHQRVLSPHTIVLTDVATWEELADNGDWSWASIWSPEQLAVFESVLILANAFSRSLTYSVLKRLWHEIEWVPHQRTAMRRYRQRPMTIRYFAKEHGASRSLFSSDEGKARLATVAQWIGISTPASEHIWTCNQADLMVLRPHLESHVRLPPRMAGSNAYSRMTSVTAIYTAKPSPMELALFRDLGVDPAAATETREYETIFQFACRSSVRDPGNAAKLTINVYDKAQASYLHDLFSATGYVDPTLELVDLGFAHHRAPTPMKPGPKPVRRTSAEQLAKTERKRELARKRQRKRRARARRTQERPQAPTTLR